MSTTLGASPDYQRGPTPAHRYFPIQSNPAADEVIRSSWSASNIANRAAGADADEAIRSSWSARTITNRDAGADADNLIRNSWAAGQIAN
ncbi:MAG: hypothetical protein MMC33_003915 [Icmadophila ericetorum]|nr:hypothetical protein [Icmadophila ericetorum]